MQTVDTVYKPSPVEALTHSARGHMLHHNGIFSKDGKWVVFDGRNDDTKIGETATIGVVHVETGEEQLIYQTQGQTQYGPGVGAVSFSPSTDRVIFIHGLPDANATKPYAIPRRTGMLVDLAKPGKAFAADARDITAPYVPGSLRGGTHSHAWSPDGNMLSFTYNDEGVESDLRTVGVMLAHEPGVQVDQGAGNTDGAFYAAIVSQVCARPEPGSDEIEKAFDECWLPRSKAVPERKETIVFQGNTRNAQQELVTDIFMVEIDPQLILADTTAVGQVGERPRVPQGLRQQRLTYGAKLSDQRHWLRASPDGQYVYALARDEQGHNQLLRCKVASGEFGFVSANPFSITSPFNLSPNGHQLSFVAANNVFVQDLERGCCLQLTANQEHDLPIVGAPSFSPDGSYVLFNQYERIANELYVQIKRLYL